MEEQNQSEILRRAAKWFFDHHPTAVLPGGKDTAVNEITHVVIKSEIQKEKKNGK